MITTLSAGALMYSCSSNQNKEQGKTESSFEVECDRFADLQVLRYEIPGFEELTPQQKELAYYLFEAANAGRDIIYDQNNKNNLLCVKPLKPYMRPIQSMKIAMIGKSLKSMQNAFSSQMVCITIILI